MTRSAAALHLGNILWCPLAAAVFGVPVADWWKAGLWAWVFIGLHAVLEVYGREPRAAAAR